MTSLGRLRVAILDDYQGVALSMADWSRVGEIADITCFREPVRSVDEAARALEFYDVVCLMRERMPFGRDLIERLPNLKLICISGSNNRTLDVQAAAEHGVTVCFTAFNSTAAHSTPELAWALILAASRHIVEEDRNVRAGNWQQTVGWTLHGKTLGLLGLGRIGARMAEIGRAFGMDVIAWSQNLTEAAAAAKGVRRVEKETLFRDSDVVSIHLVLSDRSLGLVGAAELDLMKPSALLVNTSRGPIVDEAAMMAAVRARRISAVALDVYDIEPLPSDHPIRDLPHSVLTPHIAFVVEENYRTFYRETVENILAFAAGHPLRVLPAAP